MGLFNIFGNKDHKIVKQYRDYKSRPFGVGLKIDNLTDEDILWIHNNVKENFNFSDFPKDIKLQKIPDEVFFVVITECLEIFNANNKSKDIHTQFLKGFLEPYLNNGVNGIISSFRPGAFNRLVSR